MSEKTIVILVLGVLIFDFLLDLLLNFLNEKSSKKPIPEELKGVYDDEKYQKSQDYQNNWAGTAHNNSVGGSNTVPDGTYYYIVTLKNSGIDPINGYIYVGTK